MGDKITKFSTDIKIGAEPMVLELVGSNEAVDRDGDVIKVAGWDLTNYQKNPIFLWSHDPKNPSSILGRATQVVKDLRSGVLRFTVKFSEANPMARMIYELFKDGTLNACSVGFVPKKAPEARVDKDGRQTGHTFDGQELLELSAVAVPSNPDALQMAYAKGLITPVIAKGLGLVPAPATTISTITKEDKAMEVKEESKAVPSNVSTAKADEAAPWSAPSLKDFTNKAWGDLSDPEKTGIAGHYAWAKELPPAAFGDLKLPHHEPKDGKVVWRGVAAAMGALLGARGGVQIPDAEKSKVYAHIAAHYKAFGKQAPPMKAYSDEEIEKIVSDEIETKNYGMACKTDHAFHDGAANSYLGEARTHTKMMADQHPAAHADHILRTVAGAVAHVKSALAAPPGRHPVLRQPGMPGPGMRSADVSTTDKPAAPPLPSSYHYGQILAYLGEATKSVKSGMNEDGDLSGEDQNQTQSLLDQAHVALQSAMEAYAQEEAAEAADESSETEPVNVLPSMGPAFTMGNNGDTCEKGASSEPAGSSRTGLYDSLLDADSKKKHLLAKTAAVFKERQQQKPSVEQPV